MQLILLPTPTATVVNFEDPLCGVFGQKHLEKKPAAAIKKLIALPG
jgi:hypothetical protein